MINKFDYCFSDYGFSLLGNVEPRNLRWKCNRWIVKTNDTNRDFKLLQWSVRRRKTYIQWNIFWTNGIETFSIRHSSKNIIQIQSSSSFFGCSHSGVATVDVFKHPHTRFGSVLRRMPFLMQPTDSRAT